MTQQTHQIIERDVTFTEFTLEYDVESDLLEHVGTTVGDSLSGYDTEYRCSCGVPLDTYEDAREHAVEHAPVANE